MTLTRATNPTTFAGDDFILSMFGPTITAYACGFEILIPVMIAMRRLLSGSLSPNLSRHASMIAAAGSLSSNASPNSGVICEPGEYIKNVPRQHAASHLRVSIGLMIRKSECRLFSPSNQSGEGSPTPGRIGTLLFCCTLSLADHADARLTSMRGSP